MEWVETTGRSVTEAMDAALDQLGVDEQEAEIQILEEPQTGLFGRLKVEARVRARVRPTTPRAKVDRKDRRRRNDRKNRKGSRQPKASASSGKSKSSAGSTGGKQSTSGNGASGKGKSGHEAESGDRARTGTQAVASGQSGAEPETSPGGTVNGGESGQSGQTGSGRNRRRRRRGGSGSKQGAQVVKNETPKTEASPDLDGQRVAVEEFLTGLVAAFGRPEAKVSAEVGEDDTIAIDIQGSELGLLVGPKGQTLQALHELTRSVLQRRFVGEPHARLQLDVAGYRQRRAEALERFTREVAEEVVGTGRSKALDPMPANDRKIVHDVINTIDEVETVSEGEDPDRRVVIQRA